MSTWSAIPPLRSQASRPAVWGHRGARADAPENTLEALAEARRQGADGVEIDVRLTVDGALAVHHDAWLPDGRAIASTAAADLPGHVPGLLEALDACAELCVDVELKELPGEPAFDRWPELIERAAAALASRPSARALVSSFFLPALDAWRALAPAIPAGWLLLPGADVLAASRVAAEHGVAAIHPWHADVTAAAVAAAHDAGLRVHVWTVDTAEDVRRVSEVGVDALITDHPGEALRWLGRPSEG